MVYLSYTADVLQPQHRTAGFGEAGWLRTDRSAAGSGCRTAGQAAALSSMCTGCACGLRATRCTELSLDVLLQNDNDCCVSDILFFVLTSVCGGCSRHDCCSLACLHISCQVSPRALTNACACCFDVLAGLIIAAYSTGFMIGPQVAQLLVLDATTATLVAGAGCVAAATVVLLAVPESRPPGSVAAAGGILRLQLVFDQV